jgi:hypothetical protein
MQTAIHLPGAEIKSPAKMVGKIMGKKVDGGRYRKEALVTPVYSELPKNVGLLWG